MGIARRPCARVVLSALRVLTAILLLSAPVEAQPNTPPTLTVYAASDLAFALKEIAAVVKPDMFQLHGAETPERVREVAARFGRPVMKAIPVATAEDARRALAYRDAAQMILFDARPPKGAAVTGGHGVAFDWRLIDGVKDEVAFMLAGGLTIWTAEPNTTPVGFGIYEDALTDTTNPGVEQAVLNQNTLTRDEILTIVVERGNREKQK